MIIEIQQVGSNPARRWDVVVVLEHDPPIFIGWHSSWAEAHQQAVDLAKLFTILVPGLVAKVIDTI